MRKYSAIACDSKIARWLELQQKILIDRMGEIASTVGRAQDQVRLIEGSAKRIHPMCFGTSTTGLPFFVRHVAARAIPLIGPPLNDNAEGILGQEDIQAR